MQNQEPQILQILAARTQGVLEWVGGLKPKYSFQKQFPDQEVLTQQQHPSTMAFMTNFLQFKRSAYTLAIRSYKHSLHRSYT